MHLLTDCKCRVLHVTLNRPDKRNALTWEMCSGIVKAVSSAQEREDVGCILISAIGQVFCAGMDLDEAVELHGADLAAIHEDLFTIGATSLKPIVVCVNGPALGGGLGLAAQGHVILAAQGAVFGLPEIKIGLWPFLVYRAVEAALGPARTLEISLLGRMFPAHDAMQWGLVHQICAPSEVGDRARGLARELAKASPAAIAAGMQYFHDSREKSSKEAGELAASLRVKLMESEDFREGYAAFKQKREPRWPSMPNEFYADRFKTQCPPAPAAKAKTS
ncbi:MAG: enoyl-CoA hydratase/isomerase family protein [Bryobacteraceae bacterium]